VEDTKIWTGCEYIYNVYDNGQDTAFFMCRDQINALTVEHITRDTDYDAVLACQDKCLRIVQGSTLVVEIPTLAPATAIASKGTAYCSLSFAVLNFSFLSGQALCLRESLLNSFASSSDEFHLNGLIKIIIIKSWCTFLNVCTQLSLHLKTEIVSFKVCKMHCCHCGYLCSLIDV
jgi:hypothetical protein